MCIRDRALGTVIGNQWIGINLGFSIIEAISIIPFFYIINYGVSCLSEIKTNYIFSVEELISIAIILCLIAVSYTHLDVYKRQSL